MKQPNQLSMMHIPGGEGTSLSGTAVVKLAREDTQGVYVLMEERLPPQATIESAAHGGQTSFYVLSGSFAWYRQGQTMHQTQAMALPGDILHLPVQEAWTGQNVGKTTGTLLAVVLPAGTSASFRHIKSAEGDALAVLTDVGTFKLTGADTLGAYLLMH